MKNEILLEECKDKINPEHYKVLQEIDEMWEYD